MYIYLYAKVLLVLAFSCASQNEHSVNRLSEQSVKEEKATS